MSVTGENPYLANFDNSVIQNTTMGFITFPCWFNNEDEEERAENLGIAPKREQKMVSINSTQICSFKEGEEENSTEVVLSNQDSYLLAMHIDDFIDIITEVDNYFDFSVNVN